MNEKGLVVNGLYHPGYASYPPLDPAKVASSIEVTDEPLYLLATCASTKEARDAINAVTVVASPMKALGGIQPPLHRGLPQLLHRPARRRPRVEGA